MKENRKMKLIVQLKMKNKNQNKQKTKGTYRLNVFSIQQKSHDLHTTNEEHI